MQKLSEKIKAQQSAKREPKPEQAARVKNRPKKARPKKGQT